MDEARRKRYTVCFVLLGCGIAVLAALNAALGSSGIPAGEILRALKDPRGGGTAASILWNIRMPRLLAAAILGGALSVSGFLLQTYFGNPIAGPFVLGVSSGAKLTVALAMILCLSRGIPIRSWTLIAAAFLGAMLCMGAVLAVSRRMGSMALLVVCGVMIGYICTAVTDIVVTFADDSNIVNLHNWSMGSFAGTDWAGVRTAAAAAAAGLGCAVLLAKPMGAFQLGEDYARSMGVNVGRFRAALILLSSLLSATVTAFAGPISFVGVAVPHLMRSLFRTGRPLVMVPACFLGGGAFCLFCDLIARLAFAPAELSISTVTAVFGVPVVISMLLRRRGAGTHG